MLEVSISFLENIPCISLDGRFDGLGAQTFEKEIEQGITTEKQWIIDFSQVSYLSSAGIRSLLKYAKKLAKVEGRLILIGLSRDVKSVLEMTGMLQLFGQAEGMEAARLQIKQLPSSPGQASHFVAQGKECTWQMLSEQVSYLDIWNPLKSSTLENIQSTDLIAASLDDLHTAFGIGGLGFDRMNAFEGLGSFIALERMVGVLPADAFNQADFMVVKDPHESMIHIASAVGFSGQPFGKLDFRQGEPMHVSDMLKLILQKLQEIQAQTASLVGIIMLGQAAPGNGSYYSTCEDLINHQVSPRELNGQPSVMLIGLGANAGWKANEHLALLLAQHDIQPGDEFFLGNMLSFTDLLEWEKVQRPEEVLGLCSDLEFMQDVCIADKSTALSEGRVWFYVVGEVRSGEEKQLQLEIKGDIAFPDEWEIITRRLYADARRVVLDPLSGGFSLGKPFRVTAYDAANRRMLPTVLKIGPTSLIENEIQNHQKYVHGYILNNSTTIMGQTTCGTSTGMRYNFVGISGPDSNLGWLTNRFRERPTTELIPLFDKIFTHILKPWYGQPRWEMIKPYQDHNPLGLFPTLLAEAEKEFGISADEQTLNCPELGLVLPNPYHFLNYKYPARQSASQLWYTGINHGDLNMQNILLDDRDNVYIIDFSDTRIRNIVSDFARLEPIFKFEMTSIDTVEDLTAFLVFEQALAQLKTLDEIPAFAYQGHDPSMEKVYQMICRIRKYAKTVVLFETDLIPYLLAMLEWTYPIVLFRQLKPYAKKAATYSAALIVEQIMRLEAKDQASNE